MPEPSMRNAVKRAAKILDREVPGWRHKMQPERLYMANTSMCALGQLFGPDIEMSIAKELFPAEWRRTQEENGSGFGIGLQMLARRIFGRPRSKGNWYTWRRTAKNAGNAKALREFDFLKRACGASAELKCFWAEEVGSRRAKEEVDAEATTQS